MTKEEMASGFRTGYAGFREILACDDLETIRKTALSVHAQVHPAEVSGGEEKTAADLAFAQMTAGRRNEIVPRQIWDTDLHYAGNDRVPTPWLFWHTSRIEDLVSNILMTDGKQIFDERWKKDIGSSITDTGNALTLVEAEAFCGKLDLDALYAYMIEVGKNARKIMAGLSLEDLRSMVREETVMRILEEGGVTVDFRSVWLLVFWGRLTRAEMILTPLTFHHLMHFPVLLDRFPEIRI